MDSGTAIVDPSSVMPFTDRDGPMPAGWRVAAAFPKVATMAWSPWRALLVAALTTALAGTVTAQGRPTHVVGHLHTQSDAADDGPSAFRVITEELARLGHGEGRTIAYERRFADGDAGRFPALAADLVARGVDVIIAQTSTGALAARRVTDRIPIVFIASGDAVGSGLVASLARPGGNVTGNSFLGGALAVKQLELVRELVLGARRIAFVGNASLAPEPIFFEQMQAPARTLGLAVVFVDVRGPNEFDRAVETLRAERVDAVIWAPGGYTERAADRDRLVKASADLAIPAIHFRRELVATGGLMSYGPRFAELYRNAAVYMDRILKGEKPADLPVQQPTQFELVVNARTARALGITIPPNILARADEVIE
ncbi:MAG: ABC transporter substrate-binding protein [Alphaproteobacteria bacterium]|nr:ABC transporter substrate-binding protein [Alphaproteobacteria bacterium]